MNGDRLNNEKILVCKYCGYDSNLFTAKRCLKCGKDLKIATIKNSTSVSKAESKSLDNWLLTPWMIRLISGLVFLFISWLIYCAFITVHTINRSTEITDSLSTISDRTKNTASHVKLYNSFKEVQNVPNGTFNYGVSATFAALTAHGLNDAISAAHPNFRLRYTQPKDNRQGSKKAIAMLLDSQLSFAQQGASLKDADYSKAQQRGFRLKQIPIALDALVFFTDPVVSIPGLSVEQLKDIYKGKLTNWKQVGGPNLPIIPFARDPKASNLLNHLFGEEVRQISSNVQVVNDYTEAIRKVTSTPGGIFFGGSGLIVGQQSIRPLAIAKDNSSEYVQPLLDNNKRVNASAIRDGSYPLTRRLFVVVRSDGTLDELAGEAYANMLLSLQGQQIVDKAGLVPLR